MQERFKGACAPLHVAKLSSVNCLKAHAHPYTWLVYLMATLYSYFSKTKEPNSTVKPGYPVDNDEIIGSKVVLET